MKKILFGLLALVLIAGCSTKPAETTPTPETVPTAETTAIPDADKNTMSEKSVLQCTMESDGDMVVRTYAYTDNKVTNVVVETSYSFANHDIADLKNI
ncbi:MAG: lipoprotein [Anaerorhabdus sp.]